MTSRRPHLLYTAWGFPPSRAGGVYRALATVNAFSRAGWDVTVLTVPRGLFLDSTGGDTALEERVDPSVRIERVPVATPAFESELSGWSRLRARAPELWTTWDWRHDLLDFPERAYGRWRRALEDAARSEHARHRVDLSMGTANPNVDFIPGWELHRRAGVPYVMDYRDAWRLDVFAGRTIHSRASRVGRWERRLQRSAAEVWFVNEPIRAWHRRMYPVVADRFFVVANGFEEYEVTLRAGVRSGREAGLVFGYVGTVSDKVPLRPLLDGWRRARERDDRLRAARLVIHGYLGHFAVGGSAVAEVAERSDGVFFAGPVSKSRIGEVYAGFDALVLALGSGRYVTSGKVYEYAATGIPVVSVHDPANAATEVLSGSPAWVATPSLRTEDVASALIAGADLALGQNADDRARAQRWATMYERERQLEPRIAALRARVESGGRQA